MKRINGCGARDLVNRSIYLLSSHRQTIIHKMLSGEVRIEVIESWREGKVLRVLFRREPGYAKRNNDTTAAM